MKGQLARDITEGLRVDAAFLVVKKETAVSKSGKPYLTLKLADSTGEVEARIWDGVESLSGDFSKDDVVRVRGMAVSYQGRIQINVSDIKRLATGEFEVRDYLPSSRRLPSEMMAELDGIIAGINDPDIRGLVAGIFSRPGVRDLFMIAPAAKAMHHPYLGGLLEHTLSLCVLGRFISTHYNGVNRDLLTAGLILHDIGKIYELSYSKSFDYTDEGRLLGHITMGIELVDSRIREMPGFPRDLAALIKHMLLSHHGYLEFGSPKRPKTLEAMLLYYLDDLDAKTNAIQSLIGVNGAAVGEKKGGAGRWTDYQRLLERYIYKGVYPAVGQEGKGEKAEERAAGWSAGEKTEDVIVPENVEDESDLFRKG